MRYNETNYPKGFIMNLSDSVIIPREDFVELEYAAYHQPPASPGDRIATTVQTTIVFALIGATIAGTSWAWYKVRDEFEKKSYERQEKSNWKFKTSSQF